MHLLPGLAHSVDPPHCLLLCGRVQCRLAQNDMRGLSDVESVGTNVQGQEENTDTGEGLEGSEAFLKEAEWQERDGPHAHCHRLLLSALHCAPG